MEESRISSQETEVRMIYQQLIEEWNKCSAKTIADLFAEDGELIDTDGNQFKGKKDITSYFETLLANHSALPNIVKVREVNTFDYKVATLRAVAEMTSQGQSNMEMKSTRIAHHTLVARNYNGKWNIILFKILSLRFTEDKYKTK